MTEYILDGLKAFAVVMFGMNVGVILTWVDRRQGAMMQDRVGPERAGVYLPKRMAQGALLGPAIGTAAIVFYLAWAGRDLEGAAYTGRAMLFSQLAILFTWLTFLVIAGRIRRRGVKNPFDAFIATLGDPRRFFYAGFGAHLACFFVAGLFRGTPLAPTLKQIGYGGGAGLLAGAIVLGGAYAAYRIRHERVRLRLAGLLHPAADGLKTLLKEDFIPPNSDRLLHSIAPFISFFPALVVLAVVPFGDTLCFGTENGELQLTQLLETVPREGVCTAGAVNLQVIDLNVGVLYFFAMAGTGIVGAALAGWASDNKYSLFGGVRAASQMVSYEVTLGLTIIGAVMIYGTLQVDDMVRWQAENAWGIFVQPFAFFLFFAAAVAESKRIPFDLPEGESELVAGYFTEYAGMKFAMFFFSEYIAVVSASALMTALFLGGWSVPFLDRDGFHVVLGDNVIWEVALSHGSVIVLGVLAFVLKVFFLCWLQITIRWTLPRFRYDQLMQLGWRKLLPASLINILATGLVILLVQGGSAQLVSGLRTAGQVTDLVTVVLIIAAVGSLFALFLKPASHRQGLAATSAQFASLRGGTRSARMTP